MATTTTLDARYPNLSSLVRTDLGIDLEALAGRQPATSYALFDLERLLAHLRQIESVQHDEIGEMLVAGHNDQVRGYLATLDEFVRVFHVPNARTFLRKKLQAPTKPRPSAPSTEMLDTLAECCWGLWLHDRFGNVDVEKAFPNRNGDADFYVVTDGGSLWIDCVSPAPADRQSDIAEFFAETVIDKWRDKFGRRAGAAELPSAIAVNLLKNQEHLAPRLVFDEITGGGSYVAPARLWSECPSLRHAWLGLQSWSNTAQRPNVIATWSRPISAA